MLLWYGRDEWKPKNDLPKQEYWSVYWCETETLYTQGTEQVMIGPLRER